ncbi:MAG: UDP-N-acetylmuramate dehydrogenase [Chlamydiales bacterium]|nr:UDP-N-acetylmuramate dehydrogenase [Chlamydiales bacterium]
MDIVTKPFQIHRNVLLKHYSTFGIGGPASFLMEVFSAQQLKEALAFIHHHELSFIVIGKGSNCLFDDRGYLGAVIVNKIAYKKQEANIVDVSSGYSFALLGVQTAKAGYAGLEFASGIPGSVGGAIYMNAGAGGNETKDYLKHVVVIDKKGDVQTIDKKDITFGYRYSSFQNKDLIILSAVFSLIEDCKAKERQSSLLNYRLNSQPYDQLSVGCCFKNPSCGSAGALIEQLQLKGFQIGGAKVSEKHANFIINAGGATAADVLAVMETIEKKAKEVLGITMHREVRVIAYDI